MTISPGVRNWTLLAALVAMWGSAFMFIKLGVATVPPATLVAGRLAISALILYTVLRVHGLALPPLGHRWLPLVVLALVGNCMPFYLITWGQQFIDSALAGILIAAMPLATLVLAHWFVAGERMTVSRVIGFSLGFFGIVVLMGPAALAGLGGSLREAFAQATVLGGALCYAVNTIIARRSVTDDFVVASTAVMIVASCIMAPIALVVDHSWSLVPSIGSVAAMVWLGVGPTAIAPILYFLLPAAPRAAFFFFL